MYQNYMNLPQPMTMNGQSPTTYNLAMRQEIVKVNGENGARAFQLAPNSSVLLLDEHNPIIWLVTTDGAGYKTVSCYSITPYQPEPAIDLNSINARLKRLEAIINESDNSPNERQGDKSSASNADVATAKRNK